MTPIRARPPARTAFKSILCRLRPLLAAAALLAATAPVGAPVAAPAGGPQRVLILDSFGRDFAPYSSVASTFRTELVKRAVKPIEFLEVSLETARSETPDEDAVVEYVRVLCARRTIDLVVANGQPAVRFWLQHRRNLSPRTPSVAIAEARHLEQLPPDPGAAIVAFRIDLPALLNHILHLLPSTTNVVVILGDSPLERFWLSELQQAWRPFEGRIHVTYLNDLPFEEMLQRTASLPPRSVVFFALMLVDAAGVPHEQATAVERLHARSNAPIFGWSDDLLGHGITGGPLVALTEEGRRAAYAAERILAGEPPGAVEVPVTEADRVAYDWRELQRWSIDASRLAPGNEVLFRPASILRAYRWWLLAALGIFGAQALVIAQLLVLRHRRVQAEGETLRLRRELAHAGRVSIMGQLASSLAHELNQPLGAILRNAEAADLFLDQSPPNLDEVRAIIADIRKDDQRAGGVIDGIRTMLRRQPTELAAVDPGAIVNAVVGLVRPDAQLRGVTLAIDLSRDLPWVRGNQVQLQQVLLNLMINGMDAMEGSPGSSKTLTVRAGRIGNGLIEVVVSDCGPGIPAEELPRIFEDFYTTKSGGMGMGLSICRRFVEAHGGRIRAVNDPGGGASVHVTLPVEGGGP